jgi:hypothetical protein
MIFAVAGGGPHPSRSLKPFAGKCQLKLTLCLHDKTAAVVYASGGKAPLRVPELHLAQIFHWTRGLVATLAQMAESGLSGRYLAVRAIFGEALIQKRFGCDAQRPVLLSFG